MTFSLRSAILDDMEWETEHIGETEEWRAVDPAAIGEHYGSLRLERKIPLWALVLEARYLPCRIEPEGENWRLLVPETRFNDALNELRLFEEENRNWPPPPPSSRPLAENTLSTLSVLLLLATFHNLTRLDLSRFGWPNPDWTAFGSADAGMIIDGQWWRLVTALTLHGDSLHLLSNLVIGGFFVVSLCGNSARGSPGACFWGQAFSAIWSMPGCIPPAIPRSAPPPRSSALSASWPRSP